jgi:predicted nucleic acid-binding protein
VKLLIDINVVIDVILARAPWYRDAALLLDAIDNGRVEGYVAGHTITTAYYVIAKQKGRPAAATAVSDLLRVLEVVPIEAVDLHQALVLGLPDFEDSVQVAAALKVGADYVVTRDAKDFRAAPLNVRNAGEVLRLL